MLKKNKMKIVVFLLLFFVSLIYIQAAEELPDNGGIISSAQIIDTVTGTGPFDDNDDSGNDSSADNNIVRSFDTVTWTIENTMAVNGTGESGYMGGKIYFEASLPSDVFTKETASWDVTSMGWVQDATISDDGLTLTGYYQMSSNNITVPGKQNLTFIAKIEGAGNGTELQPTINLWLNGNNEENKVSVIPDVVTISAKARYNINFQLNGNGQSRGTVNLDGVDVTGRMYAYSIVYQLYNEDEEKGMKGLEFPTGDITLDLDMSVKEYINGSLVDITEKVNPVLWNYHIDKDSTAGSIEGRTMFKALTNSLYFARWTAPYGVCTTQRWKSIYNSGNVSMSQVGNKVSITIKDYGFDGTYPTNYVDDTTLVAPRYGENVGCFSALCVQIFVPDFEEYDSSTKYYVQMQESNLNATSLSGENITEQAVTTDDLVSTRYYKTVAGTYNRLIYLNGRSDTDVASSSYLHTQWNTGDGFVTRNQKIFIRSYISQGSSNEEDNYPRSINCLTKFDGECYEPVKFLDGKKLNGSLANIMTWNMYYVTKKDGTNWIDMSEMNSASYEDVLYYENLEDIPEGWICVGVWYESTSGVMNISGGYVQVPAVIKDTATIGETYAVVSENWYYNYELDRSVYTAANPDIVYPTDTVYNSTTIADYVKTEYDNDGIQISGTHTGNSYNGNSLLVIGGKQSIDITSIDSTNAEKTSYNLSDNENIITYDVALSITNSLEVDITGVNLKVTATVPKYLSYEANSCNYGEPEITVNDDETTTLVWYINNCTVNETIDNLKFNTAISETIPNGTQLDTTVVMQEVIKDDEEAKIGNARISTRTASTSVQVINLASHRLYNTVEQSVIEINEDIHYTISYKNNTDEVISDFQLLDILPYNGDSRGSSFNGTYKLDRLVVTQQDSTRATISNDNLQILYTTDETARTATSKDTNLGENWTSVIAESINQSATAIALKGEVGSQGSVTVDIYLTTENNSGLDKYINNATAQVYSATEEITTSTVTTQVIERTIEGIVWYDSNNNGVQDDNEELASNVELILTDDLGQQVTDVKGNVVSSTLTDENGYYKFGSLPMGTYYVKLVMPNSTYTLTEKEVGTNSEINSKYNTESNETDEITKLNSLDLPVLTASNVNAGLVKKETVVNVYHVEEGTDTSDLSSIEVLYPTETIEGRVDDEYTAESRETEINDSNEYVYELVETPSNATGLMTVDEINVIYEYSVIKGKIIITKTDRNDSTKLIEGATFKIERIDDGNNVSSTFTTMESTTNSNGVAEFSEVPIGKYRVTEIKAAEGYELLEDVIVVELTKENKEINITASDRLKLELPITGGINYTIIISVIGLVIVSISIVLYKNKSKVKIEKGI